MERRKIKVNCTDGRCMMKIIKEIAYESGVIGQNLVRRSYS